MNSAKPAQHQASRWPTCWPARWPSLMALPLMLISACAPAGSLETLHAISLHKESVTIAVTGHGCTRAADFQVRLGNSQTPDDGPSQELSILRIRPDRCRGMPHRKRLTLPLKRDTAHAIHLQNPLHP